MQLQKVSPDLIWILPQHSESKSLRHPSIADEDDETPTAEEKFEEKEDGGSGVGCGANSCTEQWAGPCGGNFYVGQACSDDACGVDGFGRNFCTADGCAGNGFGIAFGGPIPCPVDICMIGLL